MTQYDKHPEFIVRQETPFNGGPPLPLLRQNYRTPTQAFYVRAHAPVPTVDLDAFRLVVDGKVDQPLSLSLEDLKTQFEPITVTATLQCAGNRRSEFLKIAPVAAGSVMWDNDAISTATWTGVSLAQVLIHAGVKDSALHIAFTSLDQVEKDGETFGYGGSIPRAKAAHPEVLLAYEMNGEPLPPVHGGPLRVVVPGFIAARSVKWLAQITAQAEPSDNYYQQRDYKMFPPDVTEESVDWSKGEMLAELPTDSVICVPVEGAVITAGRHRVQGYALPGGESVITGVEVSADGGMTWVEAELEGDRDPWTWRFWSVELEFTPGQVELVTRAHDDLGSKQPHDVEDIWNFRGYMNNTWHRVTVQVE